MESTHTTFLVKGGRVPCSVLGLVLLRWGEKWLDVVRSRNNPVYMRVRAFVWHGAGNLAKHACQARDG